MPVLCVGRLKEERLNKLVNKKQLKNDGDVDEKKKKEEKNYYTMTLKQRKGSVRSMEAIIRT
jgi:hypothetical protein